MSRIFKRSDINIDSDNKVIIKHKNLPEGIVQKEQLEENNQMSISEAEEIARDIIETANQEADNILNLARENSEKLIEESISKQTEIYDEAKQNGYEDGYDAGHKDGIIMGEESLANLISIKEQEIEEISESRNTLIEDVEAEVVELINNIVRDITYGGFELNPSLLSVLVKRGINNATIQRKVSIKVSSEDYDEVIKNKAEFEKLIDSSKEVEILKDFNLFKNDCLLETEFGNINCGLDEQLNSIKESLYFILNDK